MQSDKAPIRQAQSDDGADREQAYHVARGRVYHIMLTILSCEHDEKGDQNPGMYSGVFDDMLEEACRDFVTVFEVKKIREGVTDDEDR